MNFDIALLLAQDGITNGAIYALLALALVLAFAVTRVIFIPQGEFVAYGALTLVAVQAGQLPGTVWLLLVAGTLVTLIEAYERKNFPLDLQVFRDGFRDQIHARRRGLGIGSEVQLRLRGCPLLCRDVP